MMAKYIYNDEKLVNIGDTLDLYIPPIIATVKFDARHSGEYVVNVYNNGNYLVEYIEKGKINEIYN